MAVIFNPNDPAQTYQDLLDVVLVELDSAFTEDPKLWQFTKRDLRWKLKRICKKEVKKEEQAEKEKQEQEEDKRKETKKETKVRDLTEKLEKNIILQRWKIQESCFTITRK